MIEVVNLGKYFYTNGKKKVLFEGVSFVLREGDFISLTGESGCGKTTLVKIIAGIETPSEGYVIYDGVRPSFFKDYFVSKFRNKNIGFAFQTFELIESISVIDNVSIPVYLAGASISRYRERAREILRYVGMDEYINSDVKILSGGQKQRVALARALIMNPKYIFADEPTANLDEKNAVEIVKLLERINREMDVGIIFITHRIDVMEFANKLAYIKDGKFFIEDNGKMSLFKGTNEV